MNGREQWILPQCESCFSEWCIDLKLRGAICYSMCLLVSNNFRAVLSEVETQVTSCVCVSQTVLMSRVNQTAPIPRPLTSIRPFRKKKYTHTHTRPLIPPTFPCNSSSILPFPSWPRRLCFWLLLSLSCFFTLFSFPSFCISLLDCVCAGVCIGHFQIYPEPILTAHAGEPQTEAVKDGFVHICQSVGLQNSVVCTGPTNGLLEWTRECLGEWEVHICIVGRRRRLSSYQLSEPEPPSV